MKSGSRSPIFEEVLGAYLNRRTFLKNTAVATGSLLAGACSSKQKPEIETNLLFEEVAPEIGETLRIPEDYQSQVLIRWGDPIFPDVDEFDPLNQSAKKQLKQFGYNNDFVGFLPLPLGSDNSDNGLLVVNHEYTNTELMFPGSPGSTTLSKELIDIDIAAHGLSVVEIKKEGDTWQIRKNSAFNRRITPDTPMKMSGAAAGSSRLQTILSKDGVKTFGTYGNCAGGVTPWGTVLTAEENVDGFFSGNYKNGPEAENYERFGVFKRYKNWGEHIYRWNLDLNPSELLHAGWIVEIDPYDPSSKPKKRTSLGRFKHEACNIFINPDGRVVGYSGDDQRFEYIYKFVSKGKYDPENRNANLDLLDEGTLYVAKFEDDGTLNWLPLVFGSGPLSEENGFKSQADVCLDTRKAADLLGATPMDRPEDIEINPKNARVYAMLTNNPKRSVDQVNAANPRAHNSHGQVLEFWPEDGDHANTAFTWELFLLAGNPKTTVTKYNLNTSEKGWLSCPDNCAFDNLGNLWIASDGAQHSGIADGLWATEVNGPARALTKRFMNIPKGAELCGPFFTPNSENLFCAIQHPARTIDSDYDSPSTRWPDFDETLPPRPAVVVTRKKGGGRVGS